jgi:hypothetical protein
MEVEQGAFAGPIGIVDSDPMPTRCDKACRHFLVQTLPSDGDRGGPLTPEMDKVSFPTTCGTV